MQHNKPQRRKKKLRTRNNAAVKMRLADAGDLIDEAVNIAAAYGIVVEVSKVESNGRQSAWHVMFNCLESKKRLLDWWPTKGTWWNGRTNAKGRSQDVEEVVGLARDSRQRG